MATLSDLKRVKIESNLPENSKKVVTNALAKIRTLNVQEKDGTVKVFINLETDSGDNFPDVITFKDGNVDSTLRYFSMHAGHIFKQFGNDYETFTESFDEVMSQLENIKANAMKFRISTVRSAYNPEYVDVLYGDEQPQAS